MKHNKATYRAMSAMLGLSTAQIARLTGLAYVTIYKAKNEKLWGILEHYKRVQDDNIKNALVKVTSFEDNYRGVFIDECKPPICLIYWGSSDHYAKHHPGKERVWQMANATTQKLATILDAKGYYYEFVSAPTEYTINNW